MLPTPSTAPPMLAYGDPPIWIQDPLQHGCATMLQWPPATMLQWPPVYLHTHGPICIVGESSTLVDCVGNFWPGICHQIQQHTNNRRVTPFLHKLRSFLDFSSGF